MDDIVDEVSRLRVGGCCIRTLLTQASRKALETAGGRTTGLHRVAETVARNHSEVGPRTALCAGSIGVTHTRQFPRALICAYADFALLVARMEGPCRLIRPHVYTIHVPSEQASFGQVGHPAYVVSTAFPGVKWHDRTMLKALVWAQ